MLPSRSSLRSWNADSLAAAAKAVEAGGRAVYHAVRDLEDNIHRMPEAGVWEGKSHEAATAMFGRATQQAAQFDHYSDAEAAALNKGDSTIGAARHWLLRAADDIDAGELQVTDAWVVLIKPARMSAQKAAQLQEDAAKEQAEVNRLLLAVGDADDATAAAMFAAGKDFDFQPPDRNSPFYGQDPGKHDVPPADEVPNPRTLQGLMQQGMVRDQDMATTVRDSREYTDQDGNQRQTLTMLDGSRHEIAKWGTYDPSVSDIYYDKNGKLISDTISQQRYDGAQSTSIRFGDGTTVTMLRTADGKLDGGVVTADGRHGVLPEEFFTHPALTQVGGALTALEKQSERGIPLVTPQTVEDIGKTAKFAGPALGVATALYDTVTATTLHDACVAAFSGAAGVAGGEGLGTLGVALAAPISEIPLVIPFAAMGGNILGTWTFGYLGGIVGNVVCRP